MNTMQSFQFGTKAETLKALALRISLSEIPRFHYFSVEEWNSNSDGVLQTVQSYFQDGQVIVRSSAYSEDRSVASLAGMFTSIPCVAVGQRDALRAAVETVIRSYEKLARGLQGGDQVLIQVMVEDISMSGVVFTQDLNTGAPYYVINYDDESGRTDTVTAGMEQSSRTLFVHRDAVDSLRSGRFKALLSVIHEIERVTGHDALDIEFSVDRQNTVHILQVRKIAFQPNWNRRITIKINDAIQRMQSFAREFQQELPGIYGDRSIFGTMPDWNPAEMIGTAPRPLALSFYRYLITDYAWREARRQMGYCELPGARLLAAFSGKPYIDVRLSFNSFLPSSLAPHLRKKLVNAWLNRLSAHKELHDKIEFDVAITALTFDFDVLVEKLIPGILTDEEKEEYRRALLQLTNNVLRGDVASLHGELDKIRILDERRATLAHTYSIPNIVTVAGLLEDCITFGTIPFSILARHAFIAASFLRSLVARDILSTEEIRLFQRSIKTVASDLLIDTHHLRAGEIHAEDFMKKYGHLRPGTYDILSRRYDQREDLLHGVSERAIQPESSNQYAPTSSQEKKITALLQETGFTITSEQLFQYIREAIAGREYAKFIFTRNISDALELIAGWGEGIGLNREELSYLKIADILDVVNVSEGRGLEHHLRELSDRGRAKHEVTSALRLPYLIESPEDVAIVPLLIHRPNFITQKIVRGRSVFLGGKDENVPEIAGKIVLIEGADPGFDWIFSHSLLGLVTKFGGANSHMAIRCAEFGLPAAIGCGEQTFDRILHAHGIELNCSEERIEPINI